MNKKKWIVLSAVFIVVLIIAYGIISIIMKNGNANKVKATSVPAAEPNNSMDAWGEVKYNNAYDISIDFPSTIDEIKVKEGAHVSMGDVLVTLNTDEYQGNIYKLQEQLLGAQADIAQTQKDISTKYQDLNDGNSSDLKLLQSSLTRAKKETEDADKDVRNYQNLYDAGAASKDTLDQYTDILNQKQKAESDIEENIEKTTRSLKDELDQLNLSLTTKQAQAEQLKTDLNIMKNKNMKPFLNGNQIVSCVKNGIVQNISVNTATELYIQSTPTKILQLIDADSLIVNAEVQEEFIGNVTLGQEVNIVPTADKSVSIPGIVTQIPSIAVEKDGKRIIKVVVKPKNTSEFLKPGYSADVYFPIYTSYK